MKLIPNKEYYIEYSKLMCHHTSVNKDNELTFPSLAIFVGKIDVCFPNKNYRNIFYVKKTGHYIMYDSTDTDYVLNKKGINNVIINLNEQIEKKLEEIKTLENNLNELKK